MAANGLVLDEIDIAARREERRLGIESGAFCPKRPASMTLDVFKPPHLYTEGRCMFCERAKPRTA
jgi:hypothetical protein